jgi:uncharacterized protein with HEPN domain
MINLRLAVLLDSMRGAAMKAISVASAFSEEQFQQDENAQAATAMFLVVLGETAAKVISQQFPDFVAAHPDWPWDLMRGLRNRIVHSYDTLNVPTIWATATESVPKLVADIDAVGPLDPHTGS